VPKLDSKALTGKVDDLLASLPVLSLDAGADHTYAVIRLKPEQAGTPIGPNDLLIAARALQSGLTVVTDNTSGFDRVAGLQEENWLDSPASAP
jgi:tRNA(fMet)-specific endonuclease VapC